MSLTSLATKAKGFKSLVIFERERVQILDYYLLLYFASPNTPGSLWVNGTKKKIMLRYIIISMYGKMGHPKRILNDCRDFVCNSV